MPNIKNERHTICTYCNKHQLFNLQKFPKNKPAPMLKIERRKYAARAGRGNSNKFSKPAKKRVKISKRPHIIGICSVCKHQKFIKTKLATKFNLIK